MVTLPMLWLPILLSALIVFIAANILWMALPFWHAKDYKRVENQKPLLDALANVPNGQYMVPWMDRKASTPEEMDAYHKGPSALMFVRNPSTFSLGKLLASYFLYMLAVSFFVAYLTSRTRAAGTDYLEIFRVAGTAGFLTYAFRGVPDSIWYGKPWSITIKEMVDGLIFGLLMGGVFGWLWPK